MVSPPPADPGWFEEPDVPDAAELAELHRLLAAEAAAEIRANNERRYGGRA